MYSVDYIQKEIETLSPDKRDASIIAFNKPAILDIQNLHNNLFFTYKQFQALPQWAAEEYLRNDKVIYKKAVYQALQGLIGYEPTFSDKWILISPNFLGADFRLQIRGEKLVLEYALNTWFGTTFKQPPLVSNIYIQNNASATQSPFRVGTTEPQCSLVRTTEGVDFIGLNYTFTDVYNLTIFVPTAVFTALGTSVLERENIVRDFADRYIPVGVKYKVTPY